MFYVKDLKTKQIIPVVHVKETDDGILFLAYCKDDKFSIKEKWMWIFADDCIPYYDD